MAPNIVESIFNLSIDGGNEDPDNVIPSISSKYYDFENLDQFSTDSMTNNSFSLFHCNTRMVWSMKFWQGLMNSWQGWWFGNFLLHDFSTPPHPHPPQMEQK